MEQFSKWFVDFFQQLIKDVGNILKNFFVGFYELVIKNPINYFKNLAQSSKTFNGVDWLLTVLFFIVFTAVIIMFVILMIQLCRRYLKFSKIEHDKQVLIIKNNQLELKSRGLPQVLTQKTAGTQTQLSGPISSKSKDDKKKVSRFVKLSSVDEKYKYSILPTPLLEEEKFTLPQLVSKFKNYAAYQHGLYYNDHVISTFLAGMATSKTMILEGISGTGKTSLPYAFGKFISNDSSIISVQPSWRDRYEMMGYLNEFTKKFNETEFLKSLYEASYRTDVNLIVLDEMNLARVEYYFADFLSVLEFPNPDEWLIDLVPEQLVGDPIHLKEGKIKIPRNIWFIGTANKDDSTFSVTDKVYDRATSIEMNSKADKFTPLETKAINLPYDYLVELFDQALENYHISPNLMDALLKLDAYISENFEITFGNRIMKQIQRFVPIYMACSQDEIAGIDYIISRKIIRKFETLNLPFLQKELQELLQLMDKLFGKDKLSECKKMISKFLKQV